MDGNYYCIVEYILGLYFFFFFQIVLLGVSFYRWSGCDTTVGLEYELQSEDPNFGAGTLLRLSLGLKQSV